VAAQQLLPSGFCGPIDCSFAGGGGICNEGTLTLVNSRVTANQAGAPGSVTVFANGGGITNGQRGVLTLRHFAISGGAIDVDGELTIRQSVIAGNTGASTAASGTALAGGGGVANFAQTTIEQTLVIGNHLAATGLDGSADGGGIWNGDPGDGRKPSLSLTDSAIIANSLSGSTGVTLRGGGLFTAFPATLALTRTLIVGNHPDQCFGC
jgi:hypothetical protein